MKPRLCIRCGMPADSLIHTGGHPERCHRFECKPKEIPLLFSAPMVRANRAGLKTQTRRLSFRGQVGDLIWQRETWWHNTSIPGIAGVAYRADGEFPPHMRGTKWKPSIFLPRWACRNVFEVTAVRTERLDDISEEDAEAEGMVRSDRGFFFVGEVTGDGTHGYRSARIAYQETWARIHGDKSWFENPTVFVVSYNPAGVP